MTWAVRMHVPHREHVLLLVSAQICPRIIDILRQNFAVAWSIICLAMLELSRYFAGICSCFDTLILNNGVQGTICGSWQRCWGCGWWAFFCRADCGVPVTASTSQARRNFPQTQKRGRPSKSKLPMENFQYSSKHPGNSTIPQTSLMNFQNSSIFCSNFAEQFFSWKLSIFCPKNCRQIWADPSTYTMTPRRIQLTRWLRTPLLTTTVCQVHGRSMSCSVHGTFKSVRNIGGFEY